MDDDDTGRTGGGTRTTRRAFIGGAAAVVAGVAVGCSGDDDGPRPDDAGGDAATPGDGSMPMDAGTPGEDAAARVDGGRPRDGGRATEGGMTADAAVDPDAGPVDGGTGAAGLEAIPEATSGFALGVASGDVTTSAAILWTRYEGAATLRAVVWEMRGDVYEREIADLAASPADGGFTHVEVTALTAGARYRYAFVETSGAARTVRSPIGRFRAAIADDAEEPLLLGAVSCVSNTRDQSTLDRAGERDDLDFFLFLGDTTYNDGARTLAEYRAKWAENLAKPGSRGVRGRTSLLATWDDHEVDNDWNPESFPAATRANATQTFFESLPLRRDAAAADRIWKRMRWGRTLEVFVLDCRGERRPSTAATPGALYVSRAQMDWLKAGLTESTAVFKLIVNSVPITDFPGFFDLATGDRWEGYAAQRTEILSHIDSTGITGVLWVAGDFHLASAGRVATSGAGARQVEVLVGPGAQSPNPLYTSLRAPQFDWASGTNNYSTIALDPDRREVTVTWIDGSGGAIHDETYAL
jgi:phosphodiesterase/alkaline phosphatase D-like protein